MSLLDGDVNLVSFHGFITNCASTNCALLCLADRSCCLGGVAELQKTLEEDVEIIACMGRNQSIKMKCNSKKNVPECIL